MGWSPLPQPRSLIVGVTFISRIRGFQARSRDKGVTGVTQPCRSRVGAVTESCTEPSRKRRGAGRLQGACRKRQWLRRRPSPEHGAKAKRVSPGVGPAFAFDCMLLSLSPGFRGFQARRHRVSIASHRVAIADASRIHRVAIAHPSLAIADPSRLQEVCLATAMAPVPAFLGGLRGWGNIPPGRLAPGPAWWLPLAPPVMLPGPLPQGSTVGPQWSCIRQASRKRSGLAAHFLGAA